MPQQRRYQLNRTLIGFFITLISISAVIGLYFGYKFSAEVINRRFNTEKIQVAEEASKPYNELVFNDLAKLKYNSELSVYSAEFKKLFDKYPFIANIEVCQTSINNDKNIANGFRADKMSFKAKAVYQWDKDHLTEPNPIFIENEKGAFSVKSANEFGSRLSKFVELIANFNDSTKLDKHNIYEYFYTIEPGSASYINIPDVELMKQYKTVLYEGIKPNKPWNHAMFTININTEALPVNLLENSIYQTAKVTQLMYSGDKNDNSIRTTAVSLPGALADYEIFFASNESFFNTKILAYFTPFAVAAMAVYLLLILICTLIYRNLSTNNKLFKLQYDFINNLTHEFKTPVSVIKIAGGHIKDGPNLSQADQQLYGKILDEESDKLNLLMDKLLSLTQIENRTIKLNKTDIDLGQFCEDICKAYYIKYSDFDLKHTINEKIATKQDKVMLTSIFQNLIDNAYKYSHVGSKHLHIHMQTEGKFVFIEFRDKGIGIPAKEQRDIFKKFYRVENEFNSYGSIGLGLAFCKELANYMGGDITVQSEVGSGAVFLVKLPL